MVLCCVITFFCSCFKRKVSIIAIALKETCIKPNKECNRRIECFFFKLDFLKSMLFFRGQLVNLNKTKQNCFYSLQM